VRTFCWLLCSLVVVVFGSMANTSAQNRQRGGVGITVFTDRNFNGKSGTYREDVPDLEPLGFNDRISSLRVGRGEQWEVCEHANYQGRCVVLSGNEPDLRRNSWNDLISSMRRIRGGPSTVPALGGDYIILFDRITYRGTPTKHSDPSPNISGRAQSVTVGGGVWELCEGQNYSGRCVSLDQSVPDLAVYNLRNRIHSVRPVVTAGPSPPSTDDWYVGIFDQPSYRGNPTYYNGTETNIFKLARSVTIGGAAWELCQGKNFTGRCVTIKRSVPDLRSHNLRQVASLRPLTRQPR
jgi:hypothetical protein